MRTLQLTKEGKRFLLAVVLIALAALNTGNNLIYLLFSMMLSLLLISLAIAFLNIRMLGCSIAFSEPIYANVPFRLRVIVENRKRLPSYSVSVELPLKISVPLYVPVAKHGLNRFKFDNVVVSRRGKYSFPNLVLKTGFPFIFLYVNKTTECPREMIVYPEIEDASNLISDLELESSDRETMVRGQEGDYFSAREYVYGEESRSIDWKATAKMQKPMVREYSKNDDRLATIILDNVGPGKEVSFERAVSIAASLCSEFIGRGYYVRLMTCMKVVPFGNGATHLFKMLDILSEVQPVDGGECPVSETMEGMSVLVMSSDDSGFARIRPMCSGVIDARNI